MSDVVKLDAIKTRPQNEEYRKGWDRIFGGKQPEAKSMKVKDCLSCKGSGWNWSGDQECHPCKGTGIRPSRG